MSMFIRFVMGSSRIRPRIFENIMTTVSSSWTGEECFSRLGANSRDTPRQFINNMGFSDCFKRNERIGK